MDTPSTSMTEERKKQFESDIKILLEKYGVQLKPTLRYDKTGIYPVVVVEEIKKPDNANGILRPTT